MKVTITSTVDMESYSAHLNIKFNGEQVFDVADGEPEDSNLGRNFLDCYNIEDMLLKAYEAGKAGEEFTVENVNKEI